jgi:hypothetical protein
VGVCVWQKWNTSKEQLRVSFRKIRLPLFSDDCSVSLLVGFPVYLDKEKARKKKLEWTAGDDKKCYLLLEFLKQCANPIAKPVSCHPAPVPKQTNEHERKSDANKFVSSKQSERIQLTSGCTN